MKNKPLAFVIMPFTRAEPTGRGKGFRAMGKEELDTVFGIVRGSLSHRGYAVRRSASPADILREIILDLDRAELVLADLTGLNPNVMYELGIRHAFCKKTILLTQDLKELPFDVSGHFCIEYEWATEKGRKLFGRRIGELLKLIEETDDPRYGPVHAHLGAKQLGVQDQDKSAALTKLRALQLELGWAVALIERRLQEINSDFPGALHVSQSTVHAATSAPPEVTDRLGIASTLPGALPAVDHLLSTAYIPEGFDDHGELTHWMMVLRGLRSGLDLEKKSPSERVTQTRGMLRFALLRTTMLITAIRQGRKGLKVSDIGNLDRESWGFDAILKAKELLKTARTKQTIPT